MYTDENLIEIYNHFGAKHFGKYDDSKLKELNMSNEEIKKMKVECVKFKLTFYNEGIEIYKLLNEKLGGKNIL